MSERNGDKARFRRERQRKIVRRARSRELRKANANVAQGQATDPRELSIRL